METSDGVVVAVHDLGGDGQPLLLAHAAGLHGLVWAPLVERLADRFRCVAFDARGHGDSGKRPDEDFDWHGFARDVLAVVDEAGLERPLGLGHSSGGAALLLAEQARPGTFRALYCYEPIVFPAEPPGRERLISGARRRREAFASREEAYANFAAKPPFGGFAPAALAAYVEHGFEDLPDGSVRLKCRPEHEARVYEQGTRHDAFRRLAEVGCPVTIARGERSVAMPAEVVETQVAGLPDGRLEVLPRLGHFGPLEDPEALAAAVRHAFSTEP